MEKKRKSLLGVYTIAIAAFFLTGFLLLVVFGAMSYRSAVAVQESNNMNRQLLSYLVTSAGSGRDGTITKSGSDILMIADGDTGYGLMIYARDGRLLEEYTKITDAPVPDPANASEIGETEIFTIEEEGERLYRITTDAGSMLLFRGGSQ